MDDLRKKISDLSQLQKVHEDKLTKVAEDKKVFEASRIQLRNLALDGNINGYSKISW